MVRGGPPSQLGLSVLLALSACVAGPARDQPAAPTGEGGTWSDAADLPRGPRQEIAVLTVGDEILLLGGFDEVANVVADVDAYSPDDDAWRSRSDLPVPLHHPNATVVGDRVFILGFLTGIGFAADGRSFVYDVDDDSWSPVAPLPTGRERGGGVAVAFEDHVYVFGGVRGGAVREVDRYHPASDAWETLSDLPVARDHLVAAAVGDAVYLVGGREGSIDSHAPSVLIYRPATDTYDDGAPMPTSRAGAAGCTLDDKIYVFGGEGFAGDPSGVFPHAEVYDPVLDAWETLAPMPTPRHGMGAAAWGGRIFIPGGATVRGLAAVDAHEVYAP